MASPEPTAAPALVALTTPEAIRDALVGSERVEFERRYRQEMAESLNLTALLAEWREVAALPQRQGGSAHERMLAVVEDLQQGKPVPTVGAAAARAVIAARAAQ